jgi:hypothetical protein
MPDICWHSGGIFQAVNQKVEVDLHVAGMLMEMATPASGINSVSQIELKNAGDLKGTRIMQRRPSAV